MTTQELSKRVERAVCSIHGWEEASNDGHRAIVAAVIEAFDNSDSALLVEPSLSRKTNRPPDIVLIDPEIGVHVLEVKAVFLDQVEAIEPGGILLIRYQNGVRRRNAVAQVRSAMFDVKDATARAYDGELSIPFRYWVVFPSIRRSEWLGKFGRDGFCPPEFLFGDDLDRRALLRAMGATDRLAEPTAPIQTCQLEQLQCVWTAFGDNSVLYVRPEHRPDRKVEEGTLGELFDQRATSLKQLSPEQKRLSEMYWESGPRLVRGVAGSGKTIVLANNLARRVKRAIDDHAAVLLAPQLPPRFAAVCYNRTLAPFLKSKIETAYEQRTGQSLPPGIVQVQSLNKLVYAFSQQGLWKYEPRLNADQAGIAMRYHAQLQQFKGADPQVFDKLAFDAIYVDEGQDFTEAEFRLLRDLCRTPAGGEPNLFVFYDDTQNLYGRDRPNWASLGLNVRGSRAFVMTECFRNPRQIVETSFNVLYGTALEKGRTVPTKDFGDIHGLLEKGLIEMVNGRWQIKFAPREGRLPIVTLAADIARETKLILARLELLIRHEHVRPEDILIITFRRDRAEALARVIHRQAIPGIEGVHLATQQKDLPLCQAGRITVSTVHSAKGYDAYIVLLASANEFSIDVPGRACFYVACTRAIEQLELFAYQDVNLVDELNKLLSVDRDPH